MRTSTFLISGSLANIAAKKEIKRAPAVTKDDSSANPKQKSGTLPTYDDPRFEDV